MEEVCEINKNAPHVFDPPTRIRSYLAWGKIQVKAQCAEIKEKDSLCGEELYKYKVYVGGWCTSTSLWGDLLRSVPFIMQGHLNNDFSQTSAALILTRNPKSTCLMMIPSHSGQAPKSFLHLLHDMSHHEMSPHDTKQ